MTGTQGEHRPTGPAPRSPHGPAGAAEGVPVTGRQGTRRPPTRALPAGGGDTPRVLGRPGPDRASRRDRHRAPVPYAPAAPAPLTAGPAAPPTCAAGPAPTPPFVRAPLRRPPPEAGRAVTPPSGRVRKGGGNQP